MKFVGLFVLQGTAIAEESAHRTVHLLKTITSMHEKLTLKKSRSNRLRLSKTVEAQRHYMKSKLYTGRARSTHFWQTSGVTNQAFWMMQKIVSLQYRLSIKRFEWCREFWALADYGCRLWKGRDNIQDGRSWLLLAQQWRFHITIPTKTCEHICPANGFHNTVISYKHPNSVDRHYRLMRKIA